MALNQTGLHQIHHLQVTLLISVTIVFLRITEHLINDRHKASVLLNQISFRPYDAFNRQWVRFSSILSEPVTKTSFLVESFYSTSSKGHNQDEQISFDVIFVRAFSYSVLEQGFSRESRITFRSINQPVIKTYRPKKGAFKVSMTFNAILFLISYTSNAERNFHSRGQSALNYWSIRSPFREIVVT